MTSQLLTNLKAEHVLSDTFTEKGILSEITRFNHNGNQIQVVDKMQYITQFQKRTRMRILGIDVASLHMAFSVVEFDLRTANWTMIFWDLVKICDSELTIEETNRELTPFLPQFFQDHLELMMSLDFVDIELQPAIKNIKTCVMANSMYSILSLLYRIVGKSDKKKSESEKVLQSPLIRMIPPTLKLTFAEQYPVKIQRSQYSTDYIYNKTVSKHVCQMILSIVSQEYAHNQWKTHKRKQDDLADSLLMVLADFCFHLRSGGGSSKSSSSSSEPAWLQFDSLAHLAPTKARKRKRATTNQSSKVRVVCPSNQILLNQLKQ